MGAVIINDSDAPGKNPNRQLNTPAGDVREINKRITEYLEKIKGDATSASMMAGREARIAARAAGLPPPRSTRPPMSAQRFRKRCTPRFL